MFKVMNILELLRHLNQKQSLKILTIKISWFSLL